MKTKLPIIFLFIGLTGCQPKSEIDKCVEAKLTATVNQECIAQFQGINMKEEKCVKDGMRNYKIDLEGEYREQCLRAQAGKP
jgi:hypothetical protein